MNEVTEVDLRKDWMVLNYNSKVNAKFFSQSVLHVYNTLRTRIKPVDVLSFLIIWCMLEKGGNHLTNFDEWNKLM